MEPIVIKAHCEQEITRYVTIGVTDDMGKVVCSPIGHEWRRGVNLETLAEFMAKYADDLNKTDVL